MSNAAIIIQIMFITIGMIFLGLILNRVLGLRKENLIDLKKKGQNLRERLKNAQLMGDIQMMAQLQKETVIFMKKIMKKQLVPLCGRCIIMIIIFVVLGFIYRDYDSGLLPFSLLIFGNGWFAIYFLFSIGFSLLLFVIKKLYKKLTGKETKTQSQLKEIMGMVSSNQQAGGLNYPIKNALTSQLQDQLDNQPTTIPGEEEQHPSNKDNSWKERIEK